MTPPPGRFRRRAQARYRVIDGEAVVVVQDRGEALVLNELGSRILELVESGASEAEMVERLLDDYEVSREVLSRDVARYLEELVEVGVVEAKAGSQD